MKILCLVKYVPNIENFKYDYENNTLIRENTNLILNKDDEAALEYALNLKDKNPNIYIEVLTMAPYSILSYLKDLARRNIDKATLISDNSFKGSDSFATAEILATYIRKNEFDLILSGSQSIDGDTGHIGPQIATILDIDQFSSVLDIELISSKNCNVKIDMENEIVNINLNLPSLLSFTKESKYKLRFVRRQDFKKNVDEKIKIVTNEDLKISSEKVGINGSPTKVVKSYVATKEKIDKIEVVDDEDGVSVVYEILKKRGYI